MTEKRFTDYKYKVGTKELERALAKIGVAVFGQYNQALFDELESKVEEVFGKENFEIAKHKSETEYDNGRRKYGGKMTTFDYIPPEDVEFDDNLCEVIDSIEYFDNFDNDVFNTPVIRDEVENFHKEGEDDAIDNVLRTIQQNLEKDPNKTTYTSQELEELLQEELLTNVHFYEVEVFGLLGNNPTVRLNNDSEAVSMYYGEFEINDKPRNR